MNKELKGVQTPGARCRLYRKRANMTQEQLAEKIHCSVDLVSAIERGSRTLTNENAAAMAAVFGVRKECLLCFDDFETDIEKRVFPFAERIVTRQMEKEAFRLYAGLHGFNVVLIDSIDLDSKCENMSTEDFLAESEQVQSSLISKVLDDSNYYYSFQNESGVEIGRCDINEYNEAVKEISEFAEFKIRKLCKKE